MILEHHDYLSQEWNEKFNIYSKRKRLQGVICLGGNFENIKDEDFDDIEVPIILTSINNKCGKEFFKIFFSINW